jgi:hypothetical protein
MPDEVDEMSAASRGYHMKRNIGAELAARMMHLNEMLANGESVGAISRADVDSPHPVASTPDPHATPGDGTSQGECMDGRSLREFHRRLMAMGGVPGRIWEE